MTVGRRVARQAAHPTLEEVAAFAGVSRATVSRVVNGSAQVSPHARILVEEAVSKLGYVPNRAARSLVSRRSDSIALIVSEPEARVFSEPFFAGIVRGVSAALDDTGIQLVLLMAQRSDQRERLERYIRNGHADGVLLISLHWDDPLPRHLTEAGVPIVLAGRPAGHVPANWVDADNRGGAREAVSYLLSRGRRRVATITGPADMAVGVDRLDGWRDVVAEAGIDRPDRLVAHGDFSEESGGRAMRVLLEREPGIDAVFAASDLMAAGALRVLRAAGRRVPDDVALVGFDDSVVARQTEPPLTSVRQPIEEMGREMTRLLLGRLAGEIPRASLTLGTELVVRASA
jgi:DNA-binding LacI/PurR family transcriptional regulator